MRSPVRSPDLEAALRATDQLVGWCEPDGGALVLEGDVEALTGRPAAAFSRFEDLLEIVHPEDRAPLAERRSRGVDHSGVRLARFRLVRPDGEVLACEGGLFGSAKRSGRGDEGEEREYVVVRALPRVEAEEDSHRLAELIEYLPEYVSIHSTDGRCVAMNAAGRRMLGIGREEDVRRLGFVDIVADSTSAPAHLLLPVVLSHGSHSTDVVMINRRNVTRVPAVWSASVVGDADSSTRYLVCIARDVSEQLEIEWELRQNQRRLTHALDVSRLGEWTMDIRTQTSSPSRRVIEIFGYEDGKAPWNYRAFLGHIHPDDRDRVDRVFTRSLETGKDLDFEARIVRRDGELRWISARAGINRGLGGDGQHIGGVIQDITTRKFAEQRDRFLADVSVPLNALVDDRSTLEQVARLAVPFLADHCSVDLVMPSGALERVVATHSLLAAEALGTTNEQGEGELTPLLARMLELRQPTTLDAHDPGRLDAIARTRSERLSLQALDVGSYLGVPLILRRQRLGVMHFYRTGSGARYGDKDRQVAQELATRIAAALENARLYAALQDSDTRKDEFLAMLSHELRNPLESLSVGMSLLESEPDPSQLDWATKMMRGQVTRLSNILEDLLDVSRYTFNKVVLRRERAALAPLLEQAVAEMRGRAEARGYAVVLDTGDTPLHVDVDTTRFGQVVSNLLTNAIKYGENRGEIRLSVAHEDEHAVIVVSDEGVGLEAEALTGVFELFSQVDTTIDRSLGGLGMGLTLVRRIVEMHGGSVAAESEGPGRGTRFVIRLPATPSACLTSAESRAEATPGAKAPLAREHEGVPDTDTGGDSGSGPGGVAPVDDGAGGGGTEETVTRRLMLVDDNVETVSALQKLFTLKGYEVRTAHDGLDALSLAERFEPHAAVLDIGLPGASGYEVASALRERYGRRPLVLVALSGYGQRQDRERAREAGFDHHLLKPANFRTIAALIEPS